MKNPFKVYCVRCGHHGPGRLVVTPKQGHRSAFQALHPYRHKFGLIALFLGL